jgi:hypothetical protein
VDAAVADVVAAVGLCARCDPVVGIDCVAETGTGASGATLSVDAEASPVRTELCVRSLMPVSVPLRHGPRRRWPSH